MTAAAVAFLLYVWAGSAGDGTAPPTVADGVGLDVRLIADVRRVASRVEALRSTPFPQAPLPARASEAERRTVVEARLGRLMPSARLEVRGRAWADIGLGAADSPGRLVRLLASDLPDVVFDEGSGRLLVAPETMPDTDFAPDRPDDVRSTVFLATGIRPDEPVLAHVLVHVLGRNRSSSRLPADATTDRLLAAFAWSEGEANLVAIRYLFQAMGIGDSIFEHDVDPTKALDGRLVGTPFEALPAVERSLLGFVHQEGFAQTVRMFRSGGWKAVEAAALSRTSSRDLLHPGAPAAGGLSQPDPSSPLPAELELEDTDRLGEQGVVTLVASRTGKDDLAMAAGDGWLDDRLLRWEPGVHGDPSGGVTVWETSWRTAEDAVEFDYAIGRAIEDGLGGTLVPEAGSGRRTYSAQGRIYRLTRSGGQVVLRVAAEAMDRRIEQPGPDPNGPARQKLPTKSGKITKP